MSKQWGLKRRIMPVLAVLLVLLGSAAARADGYVIPGPRVSSSIMADQTAVLVYRDGHEDLIISIGLAAEGEPGSQELAWVIPVPARPEVSVAPQALLDKLDRISAPEIVYHSERRGLSLGLSSGAPAAPPAVEVLARQQVGVYDVAVLEGREAGGLLEWLQAEGFAVPDALQTPLAAYIAEGWTFVAMRLAPDLAAGEIYGGEPVWLSFDAPEMVYPMRLTAAQGQPLALRLYILAGHRHELNGFEVEFAGWAAVPATDPALASLLDREYFVTRLFDGEVTPAEMAADFYPRQAPADEPYRQQQVYTYVSSGSGVGSVELLCLGGGCCLGLLVVVGVIVGAVVLARRRRTGDEPPTGP